MTAANSLAGVLLAAGGSTRLGQPKQLCMHEGESLICLAASASLAVCDAGVTVVTGAHAAEVSAALGTLPVTTRENSAWRSGIATSIHTGLKDIPVEAKGLLVMLVDQPLISVDDLTRLAVGWRAAPDLPAASAYGGIVGVPAIFPRSCFADLLQLQGDQGAKSLLQDYAEKTIVDIAAAAFDIDTEEDLRHLH